jgi:hypothetical protein
MYDRTSILNLIEDAEHERRACSCGAPMIVTVRDGALWLDCAERPVPREGLLSRLASLDWLAIHDRRLLLEPEELAA